MKKYDHHGLFYILSALDTVLTNKLSIGFIFVYVFSMIVIMFKGLTVCNPSSLHITAGVCH